MGGITMPYDSGQSGTDRPDSVLVTRPPMKMRTSVLADVSRTRRCRQGSKSETLPREAAVAAGSATPNPPAARHGTGASHQGTGRQPWYERSTLAASPAFTVTFWVWVFSFSWK